MHTLSPLAPSPRNTGFTLIELMIVVAIVAILASIALPAYNDYVIRSKIPEATSGLSGLRVKLEQYFDNNRTYVGFNCAANVPSSKHFNFACDLGANAYTITATGKDTMAGFVYTLNEANAKATTGAKSGWSTNANCWVTRKDGSC
ncbi:type IV pilin protein [Azovibrio restrictus]|uniref:type IV pilin protein n=1 Tax=Azovibrio restrictus TaxID=146938 RepID=UPI0026F2AFB9|nr:type IV pilin protein [Azovibrio restrictus]